MAIPIANVYYLLCYAWGHLELRDLAPGGTDLGDRIENLFAYVLDSGLTRLLRQGIDRGYVSREDEIAGVRGKLLVGNTLKRVLVPRGRTACRIDEFTADVQHNRIVKAAIAQLIAMDTVDLGLRARLRRHREVSVR